jgi:hypothetical protein
VNVVVLPLGKYTVPDTGKNTGPDDISKYKSVSLGTVVSANSFSKLRNTVACVVCLLARYPVVIRSAAVKKASLKAVVFRL